MVVCRGRVRSSRAVVWCSDSSLKPRDEGRVRKMRRCDRIRKLDQATRVNEKVNLVPTTGRSSLSTASVHTAPSVLNFPRYQSLFLKERHYEY